MQNSNFPANLMCAYYLLFCFFFFVIWMYLKSWGCYIGILPENQQRRSTHLPLILLLQSLALKLFFKYSIHITIMKWNWYTCNIIRIALQSWSKRTIALLDASQILWNKIKRWVPVGYRMKTSTFLATNTSLDSSSDL